jgi:hypothetical protein
MRPIWNTFPVGWTAKIWLALVSIVFCVSACTAPGHSLSNPAEMPSDGGYAGTENTGNGGGY